MRYTLNINSTYKRQKHQIWHAFLNHQEPQKISSYKFFIHKCDHFDGVCANHLRIKELRKSKAFDVLPSLSNLLPNDWLDNLRETKEFKHLIAALIPHPHS